jgi:hypothetical protein
LALDSGSKCTLPDREGRGKVGDVGLGGCDESSKLTPRRCPDRDGSRGRPFAPILSDHLESDAEGERKREVVGEGPTLKDSKGSSPDKVRIGVCRVGLKFHDPIESLSCVDSLRPASGRRSGEIFCAGFFGCSFKATHVDIVDPARAASRRARQTPGTTFSLPCERKDVRVAFQQSD